MMSLTAVVVTLSLGGIGLRGNTTCPTVEAVQAELGDLVSNEGDMRWAELSARPDALQLSLWSSSGRVEAVRTIPLPASCEALARASAVAIATWAVQLPSAPPPPPAAVAEAPPQPASWRIFPESVLQTERLRLEQNPPPPPTVVRLRGPILTVIAGVLLGVAGVAAGITSPSWSQGSGIVATASFVLSFGAMLGGSVWFMGLANTRGNNSVFAF
jgi:hypothetical protein